MAEGILDSGDSTPSRRFRSSSILKWLIDFNGLGEKSRQTPNLEEKKKLKIDDTSRCVNATLWKLN